MSSANALNPNKQPAPEELITAVEGNNLKVAEDLLDRGADANAVAENGSTALLLAINKSCLDMVTLLVERGADPLKENNYGYNAFDMVGQIAAMCEEFGGGLPASLIKIADVLREAPERHGKFVEERANIEAEKAAAIEKARQENVSEKQKQVKKVSHKLNLKAG